MYTAYRYIVVVVWGSMLKLLNWIKMLAGIVSTTPTTAMMMMTTHNTCVYVFLHVDEDWRFCVITNSTFNSAVCMANGMTKNNTEQKLFFFSFVFKCLLSFCFYSVWQKRLQSFSFRFICPLFTTKFNTSLHINERYVVWNALFFPYDITESIFGTQLTYTARLPYLILRTLSHTQTHNLFCFGIFVTFVLYCLWVVSIRYCTDYKNKRVFHLLYA